MSIVCVIYVCTLTYSARENKVSIIITHRKNKAKISSHDMMSGLLHKEAKKAANGFTSDVPQLPRILRKPLKHSKSATIQKEGVVRKIRWRKDWVASPHHS